MRYWNWVFWRKVIGAILFLAFSGCETADIDPDNVSTGRDYFPMRVGNFWVYQVDSVNYSFTGGKTNGSFFYKEYISDTLPDQEGAKVFRIEVSKSLDTTHGWSLDSVWSVRVGKDRIIKSENNLPIVKLVFPLQEGSRWDGNQFNIHQDSSSIFWYRIKDLGKLVSFKNKTIESVEIVQKVDSNCINFTYFTEVYYKNIGMAYRRKTHYDYVSCVGIPEIEQGSSFEYNLISYGVE